MCVSHRVCRDENVCQEYRERTKPEQVLPAIPKELLDQLVAGPMAAEAVFKKALIERALGAELCPGNSLLSERWIRTLEEQCVHRHRFETLQYAMRVIGDWIRFYNNSDRPIEG